MVKRPNTAPKHLGIGPPRPPHGALSRSLKSEFPRVAADWHPTKNLPLTPADVPPKTRKRAFWRCSRDGSHVWDTPIAQRTQGGYGCPFCAGKRPSRKTCLRARCPPIAAEWHPTKNGDLTPGDVMPASRGRAWWQCSNDKTHVWQTWINVRVSTGACCPFCIGRRVTPSTSLRATHPIIAREWHPTKNGTVLPESVRPGSGSRMWWRCSRDPAHEWRAPVCQRTGPSHRGCPFCSGRRADAQTSLLALHPDLATEWHPTKNKPLRATDVRPKSEKQVYWRCRRNPSHQWRTAVCNRTAGGGCPRCASLGGRYPRLAAEWHPTKNGRLTPDGVMAGSRRRVWWQCHRDKAHVWQTEILSRKGGRSRCPFCFGNRVDAKNSLLSRCPRVAAEWHPTENGTLKPDGIRAGSSKRVVWRCQLNAAHIWRAQVQARTSKGSGCPHCYAASRQTSPRRRRPRVSVPLLFASGRF
jgi:hypothetical protein